MRDKLTGAVLEYQTTKSNDSFNELANLSEGLIYMVMKYYHMEMFPRLIQEEIINECKSIRLLKAVNSFDSEKGTKFSTHYVWKLKSYIRSKKEFYQRRYKLIHAISLDARIAGGAGDREVKLKDKLHNFNESTKSRIQKEIRDIFNK